MFCGFAIRSRESVMYYGLGDYKSPGLIGRTFFLRRIANPSGRLAGCVDAWRGVWTPGGVCGRLAGCVERLGKGGKTPSGWMNDISGEAECYAKAFINLYLSFPPIL